MIISDDVIMIAIFDDVIMIAIFDDVSHRFQTTHLRSARLEKPLQLRPKIAQKVADMCEELGVGESPLATGTVCSAYDTLLEVVTTVVNDQATTETKEAAVAQLKEKKARLEGKRQSRNRKR